jgi:hypothetical protein
MSRFSREFDELRELLDSTVVNSNRSNTYSSYLFGSEERSIAVDESLSSSPQRKLERIEQTTSVLKDEISRIGRYENDDDEEEKGVMDRIARIDQILRSITEIRRALE